MGTAAEIQYPQNHEEQGSKHRLQASGGMCHNAGFLCRKATDAVQRQNIARTSVGLGNGACRGEEKGPRKRT